MAFKLVRMSETVAYFQAEAEVNWLQRHQPEIWDKTYKYLFLSGYLTHKLVGRGYLTHKLVGRFVDSVGCQVGYVPFDYKAFRWAKASDWKWQAAPIEPDKLPDLVPPAEPLGQITPQAAEATGIPQGLPLIAAAADKACEVLGAGCLEPHVGCLSYGTTATINTTNRKYVEVIPLVPPYPSAVPGAYSLEVQVYRRRVWPARAAHCSGARHRTGGTVRRAGESGPCFAALLVAGAEDTRPRGQGGYHRFRRRAYPCAPLPHHLGGPGLRPARGSGTHRTAQQGAWLTPCARERNAPHGAARCPSPSCAWPAAAHKAMRLCKSRRTSSTCPLSARTLTRLQGWGRR